MWGYSQITAIRPVILQLPRVDAALTAGPTTVPSPFQSEELHEELSLKLGLRQRLRTRSRCFLLRGDAYRLKTVLHVDLDLNLWRSAN